MSAAPFQSPWQKPWYVALVCGVRTVLQPWEKLERRFIAKLVTDQNQRVIRFLAAHPPQKVLLIMPRCVKKSGCTVDVQQSLAECLVCRQCPLGDVAVACERRNIKALVAFRSHIAFDMARSEQPDLIVASACPDRMIKALRTVPEHPALLAPLTGMDRMCVNATVDLPWLEQQLDLVTDSAPTARITTGP